MYCSYWLARAKEGGRKEGTVDGFFLKVVVQVGEELANEGEEEGDSDGEGVRDRVFIC